MSIKTAIDKIIEYASVESEIPLGQSNSDREELEKILLQELGQPTPVAEDELEPCGFCGIKTRSAVCPKCYREKLAQRSKSST